MFQKPKRSGKELQATITAKAIAGVVLLLEDAVERWQAEIDQAVVSGSTAPNEQRQRRLAHAQLLASEIGQLTREITSE